MNNISLAKITLGVAFATIATFVVNANEIGPKVDIDEKSEVSQEVAVSKQSQTFLQLLSAYDADENGMLSEVELAGSALQSHFSGIDINADDSIDEDEFTAYID